MDLFGDQQYEELDWLTKAIEPISDEFNAKLAAIPQTVTVDYNTIAHCMSSVWTQSASLVYILAKTFDISTEEAKVIQDYFEVDVTENTKISLKEKAMIGSITLIKKSDSLSEKDLKKRMSEVVRNKLIEKSAQLTINFRLNKKDIVNRMNEVLDVLDSKDGLRARSAQSKIYCLRQSLETAIAEDKFKIRDVQLAEKIVAYGYDYIINGDLSKLTNLCRIKVMMHSGKPIYKFEETV